jgi:oleandomycin transport system permease protein
MNPLRLFRNGLTLAWRSLLKIKHSPEQLFDISLTPIMFVTLFVFLFGTSVSGNWHTYLQFVLPGVAVQCVVFASVGTATGLNTDLQTGIFDRFRSLPIARAAPLIGHLSGDFFRYITTLIVVFAYAFILGFHPPGSVLAILAACGLMMVFAFAFSWFASVIGLLAKNPQSVQGYSFILMFPLTFGSNIFVPTTKLPGWLQAWVKINPVTHLSNASRGLILHQPMGNSVGYALLWAAGFIVVFGPIATLLYRRRI